MMKLKYILLVALLSMGSTMWAQNKMLSSKQLMTYSLYPRMDVANVQFVGNTNQYVYSKDTVIYMGKKNKIQPFLTLSQLNKAVAAAHKTELKHIPGIKYINDNEFAFVSGTEYLKYNTKTKQVSSLADLSSGLGKQNLDMAPEQYHYAYTIGNNLYVDFGSEVVDRAFEDKNSDIVFGQSVHRNEFGIEKGTFWSPKGNRLAFYRMDQSMVTDYPMVNTSARIAEAAPFKYPMAGMKSHEVTVGIFDCKADTTIYLETRKNNSVAEREMYLTNLTWSPDERYLYIAKINREQNHVWMERYDVTTGKLDKVLFEETDLRYTEPCEGPIFIPNNPNQFLWYSLRDGYKHLYLYNIDGTMLRQMTRGEYEVEGFIGFDSKCENFFIYANKDNLIGRAAYKVNMKSGAMSPITNIDGTHTVTVSADGTHYIDRYSGTLTTSRCYVKNAKGTVATLCEAVNPLDEYAMPGIQMGTIKAADGKTDLYYRLITPPNMKPGEKYPTLVYVYGGPHSQLVTDSWLGGGNLYFLFLAQQGYVIFTVDNRGTDNRGFEFESCTHRHLGEIEMADQLEGVKFLKSLPYVDQDRMGVEGWSFGGFMTITMKLAHPEIFKVGCAGGPVIDWKWYEIMYGERYMDMPDENPEGYKNNSLLNKADNLEGRLLVIHGAEDNTVVWQHSIEFVEACIKAGKLVDYFIYPHHEHNVHGIDRIHLYEKMFDYYETFLK